MQTISETLASISASIAAEKQAGTADKSYVAVERPVADKPVVANLASFPQLESIAKATPAGSLNHLLDVSVCVTAELGRANMSIGDVLKIGLGSVVGLNRSVTEPVELLVQGVPFARGEVVVIDDRFAIRIREIVDPAQQAKK